MSVGVKECERGGGGGRKGLKQSITRQPCERLVVIVFCSMRQSALRRLLSSPVGTVSKNDVSRFINASNTDERNLLLCICKCGSECVE